MVSYSPFLFLNITWCPVASRMMYFKQHFIDSFMQWEQCRRGQWRVQCHTQSFSSKYNMFKASENKGVDMNWRAFEYDIRFIHMCYIYIYTQRITMCPYGYHHNSFMETPALGKQEVRFTYIYICVCVWVCYININLAVFGLRILFTTKCIKRLAEQKHILSALFLYSCYS